jgi:hypothetical protein
MQRVENNQFCRDHASSHTSTGVAAVCWSWTACKVAHNKCYDSHLEVDKRNITTGMVHDRVLVPLQGW